MLHLRASELLRLLRGYPLLFCGFLLPRYALRRARREEACNMGTSAEPLATQRIQSLSRVSEYFGGFMECPFSWSPTLAGVQQQARRTERRTETRRKKREQLRPSVSSYPEEAVAQAHAARSQDRVQPGLWRRRADELGGAVEGMPVHGSSSIIFVGPWAFCIGIGG